jgi:hypothetical protein
VNLDHAALAGQAIERHRLVPSERREAGAAHGTAIATLIVGKRDSRTPGLLPDANLVVVEIFHVEPGGEAADAFTIARAIDLLVERRVDVANLSLAGPPNAILEVAVNAALERGIGVVAAAGNGGPGSAPAYPAAYPGVIAVTAVDAKGNAYRQAGRGDHLAFAAPGVRLWAAASVSGGRFRSGTSYAAPFVTAALAAQRWSNSERTLEEMVAELSAQAIDLGAKGRDPVFGWGLVQARPLCG